MTDATVQAGHQYPNVVRVLKPGTPEYDYYNAGGSHPWPGAYNLTWTAPTERADGSPASTITSYTIEHGGVDTVTDPGLLATEVVAGNVLGFDMPTPESGKTYRARISATDDNGKTSQLSGFVYITTS